MTARARVLAFGLVALLGSGMLTAAAAWGSEPEDPFWKVAGNRLNESSQQATIANVSGVKTTLQTKIGTTEVAIRCETGALGEGVLEGSQAKQPGKAAGVLELSGCKLFAKEGEVFKEQTECKVSAIKSGKLAGKLWLEGTKAEAGTTAVVVFEPKEPTEGKPLVAKVVIEGCATFKGTRSLEGSFALRLLPQNEEFTFIQWVLPEAGIKTVWLPPSQETSVGLKLESNAATLQGEMKTELTSHEKFGGGTGPTVAIEAPFWGVGGKRLEAGEERELEDANAAPVKLSWKIKGLQVQTRCNTAGFKEPKIVGSLNQHDGRFFATSLEFSECKLFTLEEGSKTQEQGGKFIEQPACEVAPPTTGRLSGKLWLKGTSGERGMAPVLVLEPEVLTAGKPVLTKESVKGASCGFLVSEYPVEGDLPFRLQPESVEAQVVNLNLPESSTNVWQSAEQQAEQQVKVYHGEELLTLKIGNIPVKLKGGGPFGGGSAGVGEIAFESNTGRINGPIKTFPETATFTASTGAAAVTCKSTGGEAPAGEYVIQVKTTTKEGRQEATTRGPHEWLQIKKWGNCTGPLGLPAKVKCNIQVTRVGTASVYPLGTTGTTGCEVFVGKETEFCLVKVPVEGNKERPGIVLANHSVNEVEISGEGSGLISQTEEAGGLCKLGGIKEGTGGSLKIGKPLVTEGEKVV
jgi:hypothetical protein